MKFIKECLTGRQESLHNITSLNKKIRDDHDAIFFIRWRIWICDEARNFDKHILHRPLFLTGFLVINTLCYRYVSSHSLSWKLIIVWKMSIGEWELNKRIRNSGKKKPNFWASTYATGRQSYLKIEIFYQALRPTFLFLPIKRKTSFVASY